MSEPLDEDLVGSRPIIRDIPDQIFKARQVTFTPSEIRLKRNGFVYKKIPLSQVESIIFETGNLYQNVWVARFFILGALGLLCYLMLYSFETGGQDYMEDLSLWLHRGSILSLWGPLFINFFLVWAFIATFYGSNIAEIHVGEKMYRPRTREIDKKGNTILLVDFLRGKGVQVIDELNK